MSQLQFKIQVHAENEAVLPEIQARLNDMSPAFEAIFKEWVDINKQKFELSRGKESSGSEEFGEFWQALTPAYMKQKRAQGFTDWLMVRTGALQEAMTSPDALFQSFDAQQAIFGTPTDSELADIVRWQAGERQGFRNVIFLGLPDMNAIRRIIQNYLGLGGQFSQIRFEQGLRVVNLQDEISVMDAEFAQAAG